VAGGQGSGSVFEFQGSGSDWLTICQLNAFRSLTPDPYSLVIVIAARLR